ncbi:hypothetical protein [Actinoplanes sp. NPDC020271]|uniref:hypothetical protein n=1 Tax=Actinoplanes sp. NPDC020271 TaxID=3363896 RepID=UPI0037BA66F9
MAENAWLNFHCETGRETRVATFRRRGTAWELTEVATDPLPEGGAIPGRIAMSGEFRTASGYPGCPGCGADNFVRCGGCGELNCWRSSAAEHTCANCGHHGRVQGTIASLDAMEIA